MSQTAINGPLTRNDEDVLGVFDRLKANISDIKGAHFSRDSMELASSALTEQSTRERHYSRQSSINTDHRHRQHRSSKTPSLAAEEMNVDGKKVNGQNETSVPHSDGLDKRHGNRSRVESYSSRADDSSRFSTRSTIVTDGSRSSHKTSQRYSTPSESSVQTNRQRRTKNRGESELSTGRESRTSQRSHRSTRQNGVDPGTDHFLTQYHREWLLYYQYTQQQQQQQEALPRNENVYGGMYVGGPAYAAPQPVFPSSASSSNLPVMVSQPVFSSEVAPQAVAKMAVQHVPTVLPAKTPLSAPLTTPNTGYVQKTASRPQRPEWKGSLLTGCSSISTSRTGRKTTVLVQSSSFQGDLKSRAEMELFPGMMLWDSPELRDRVVDFARHMSDLANETADVGSLQIQSVFWDLVVHLVSRAENSRPYEVAEILIRLVEDTGRSSVASTRSTGGRERYSDSALYDIRKSLLVGDIESAVKYAQNNSCWDLALCLQTVSSNVECKNVQANDLAVRCLDQRLVRGDPVHTICTLACGRMPSVEASFRDWVSNLAIVVACSGFVQQEDLRQRFIASLSDMLNSADMPVARDICLIFCTSVQRFEVHSRFIPIGASGDLPGGHASFLESFSLPVFFMTEVFVFLAQILQGVNLHTKVELIKMELRYVQFLLEHGLSRLAAEYCRNITLVVKEYHLDIPFEMYAELFKLTTACVTSKEAQFQEEACQWLWNIFLHKSKGKGQALGDSPHRRRSGSIDSYGFTTSTGTTSTQSQSYAEDWSEGRRALRSEDNHVESIPTDPFISVKASISDFSTSRDTNGSTYSANSRRGSLVADDFTPYSGVGRRPSESLVSVSAINTPSSHSTLTPHNDVPFPSAIPFDHSSRHERLSARNSTDDVQTEEVAPPPPPPVQMYQPTAAPLRPSFLTPFGVPTAATSAFLSNPTDTFSPQTPSDSSLNTGNAPYFSPPSQQEVEDTSSAAKPKFHDPTVFEDELDSVKSGKEAVQKAKKEAAEKKAEAVKNNPGRFGWLFGVFKRRGQIHLPPDTKPKLVYDNVKKRWVDTTKTEEEEEETVAPPPKMHFPQPGSGGPPPVPGSGGPGPGAPPSGANLFRLSAAPASGGYNPYAHLLKAAPTNPPKMFDVSNHFIPAATIPEE